MRMLTSSSIRPSALKPTKPNHLEIARKQQGCRQFGKPNRATPNKKQLGTILGSLFRPQDSTGRSSAAIACLGQPVGHLKPQFFCGGLLDNINGSFAGCLNYRKNIICVIFTHACSEISYRITDVECVVRAKNTPVNLTGEIGRPYVENSAKYAFYVLAQRKVLMQLCQS